MGNYHGVYMAGGILLVECRGCNKRTAFTKETLPKIHQGNMDEVHTEKFRCSRCKETGVRLYAIGDMDEAKMWLAGDPLRNAKQGQFIVMPLYWIVHETDAGNRVYIREDRLPFYACIRGVIDGSLTGKFIEAHALDDKMARKIGKRARNKMMSLDDGAKLLDRIER